MPPEVAAVETPVAAPAAPAGTPAATVTDGQPAGSAPATPQGDEKTPATPDVAEKRNQSRFERRIDKLHRRAAEAEARAQLFEKQLAEFRKPAASEGSPRLENFDYDPEKYATAKAEYEKSQALKEYDAKARNQSATQAEQRLVAGWEERVARADSKYDDFDEVVGELQPNSPLVVALMEAENGEDVAYYLGKNLKEAHRIIALSPLSQIREIGKIEAKLLADPPKPKTPSQAPAPINPLTGTGSVSKDAPSDADSIGEWMKKRNKQVHGRR